MDENPLIMVVDDEQTSRFVITEILKKRGFQVVEAENGREAVEIFKTRRPELVLLDVMMPEMDGFEACRQIRAKPNGGATVPVLIITATNDYNAIRTAYDVGATDFMSKPVNNIILYERVRYMLRASTTTRQLAQNRELLAKAQDLASLGSFFYEPKLSRFQVSETFRYICGFPDSFPAITWEAFLQKIYPEDKKALEPSLHLAQTVGLNFKQDVRLASGDRGECFAMLQVDTEMNDNGEVVRLVGIVQDITARKLTEILESDKNRVMQQIIGKQTLDNIFLAITRLLERQRPQSRAAICQVGEQRISRMVSSSLPYAFCESIAGAELSVENGTCAAAAFLGQPVIAENVAETTIWKKFRKDTLTHGIHSSASVPIVSGTGQILGTVALMRGDIYKATAADIALMEHMANLVGLAIEQHLLSEQLYHQARHDFLTGLVNRATLAHWLRRILKQSIRSQISGAYLLIDLDRFKQINDSLGHHMGDLLLQEVADRLRKCIRECDVLSRVGGDEFVLVLAEVKERKDAVHAASRILKSFNKPFLIEGHEGRLEASIGISFFPQDGTDGNTLHKNADIAMYVAKNQGGNRFQFFDDKMHEAVIQRLQIENDLRKALERNEFELYYQPQLDLSSNNLIVMEALIRWNHPEKGSIAPDRFIPVAEESRLIIPIGQWVLREACRQNLEWQDQGFPPIRVAVNVSAVQFTETNFAESVRDVLAETGLDPYWLEVEITETVVLGDLEKACRDLTKLKELGVTTTLDDFGSGYSSITYLHQMPLDGIKIDQNFIRGIEIALPLHDKSKNNNFVKAFANLAKNLCLNLVAEGIENEAQKTLLKSMGYTVGQGFLFSAPLSAADAMDFLNCAAKAPNRKDRGRNNDYPVSR